MSSFLIGVLIILIAFFLKRSRKNKKIVGGDTYFADHKEDPLNPYVTPIVFLIVFVIIAVFASLILTGNFPTGKGGGHLV